MKAPTMTPLLTELEAAKMLQTSTRSVRKARQAGDLTHVQIGRLVRYRIEDVHDFVTRATVANDRVPTRHARAPKTGDLRGFTQRNDAR
jgi:excisionase family DNA binding protein